MDSGAASDARDDSTAVRDARGDGFGESDTGPEPTEDAGSGEPDADTPLDGGGGSDTGPGRDGGSGCALPVPFDVGARYERTLHVAPGGFDSGDGSATAPLGSLREAARRATPGTRIVLRAGTYRGSTYLSNLRGTAERPIAIVGEGDVVLDAEGAVEALHLTDPQYVVLENVSVRNATANGINIDDGGSYETPAHHVVLRAVRVQDVGTGGNNDCIKLSGVDDFFVLGGIVRGCNAGSQIDMVGCHRGFIHGNRFERTSGGGIQMKGGSADILVHGNVFVDVPGRGINAGGSTGLPYFRPLDAPYEAARLIVAANVFVRVGEASAAPIAFVGCDGCVFAHNTVIEPRTWVARILQETVGERFVPCRNGRFIDNIIVFRMAQLRAFVNVGANTAPETFRFGPNLWYALDRTDFSGPTLGSGIPPEMGSVIQRDPQFVDSASGDYRLQPTSPARGAASAMPDVPADFAGRCWRSPPSLGAFEVED